MACSLGLEAIETLRLSPCAPPHNARSFRCFHVHERTYARGKHDLNSNPWSDVAPGITQMTAVKSIGSIMFATPIGWAAMAAALIVMARISAG